MRHAAKYGKWHHIPAELAQVGSSRTKNRVQVGRDLNLIAQLDVLRPYSFDELLGSALYPVFSLSFAIATAPGRRSER